MASLEKTLERARIALNNALNEPQVLNTLTQYGYACSSAGAQRV